MDFDPNIARRHIHVNKFFRFGAKTAARFQITSPWSHSLLPDFLCDHSNNCLTVKFASTAPVSAGDAAAQTFKGKSVESESVLGLVGPLWW